MLRAFNLKLSFSGAFLLLFSGCGYVGIDVAPQELSPATGGGKADISGDGDDSSGGGKGLGGEGAVDGTGGSPNGGSGAGGTSTGGRGGGEVPSYPCSQDCAEPYLLYRSFEIGIPPGARTTLGASIERSESTVYRGENSMQFTQGAPGSEAEISDAVSAVAGGPLYLRAWVFIPDGAVTDWLKILGFNDGTESGVDINVREDGSLEIFSRETMHNATSDPAAIPFGQWFCVQVSAHLAETQGSVELFVNEQPAVELGPTDTLPAGGVSRIVYGLAATGIEQLGATIYFDEILASTEPVSCEATPESDDD